MIPTSSFYKEENVSHLERDRERLRNGFTKEMDIEGTVEAIAFAC